MQRLSNFLFLISFLVLCTSCNNQSPSAKEKSDKASGSNTGNSESNTGNAKTNNEDSEDTSLTNPSNTLVLTQTGTKHKLDILFVIDHQSDMSNAKEKLGENFDALKPHLEGLAWQMAFLDSNKGDGVFYALEDEDGPLEGEDEDSSVYVLTSEMSHLDEIFEYTVLRSSHTPISGSKPLESITQAFEVNGQSSSHTKKVSFFREDASLAVFLLTNKGSSVTKTSLTIQAVEQQLGHDRFIAYGFFAQGDTTCSSSSQDVSSQKVKLLVFLTEGIRGSLCDRHKKYAKTLNKMGKHIKDNLVEGDLSIQNEIPLLQNHILESTIATTFEPVENEVTWNFDSKSNKILLHTNPALGTEITITYSYTSDTDQEDEEGEEDVDE